MVPQVEEFVTRYADRRRADGVADFDDLLSGRATFSRNPEVRRYFQQRYPCVLVDEFQDTDPVQAELTLCWTTATGDGWRARPRAGPAVRRRRSEAVDLPLPARRHRDVRRASSTDRCATGSCRSSRTSARSPGVLDWVNEVFASSFGDGRGRHAASARAARPLSGSGGDRAPVVVVHGDGTATKADAVRMPGGRAAGGDVRAGGPRRGLDRAGRGHRRRAPRFLARLRDPAPGPHGDRALRERARGPRDPLPLRDAREFFASAEVVELIGLIRAIDDPSDALSIVATLRSRAFGCSDDDLLDTASPLAGASTIAASRRREPHPVWRRSR